MSAIGFSTKTCFPACRARVASSAWVTTGVAMTTASTSGSSSRSSKRRVNVVAGEPSLRGPDPALALEIAEPLEPRDLVEVAGEVRAPGPEPDLPDRPGLTASTPSRWPRRPGRSRCGGRRRGAPRPARRSIVDPRVGGHDDDAVGRRDPLRRDRPRRARSSSRARNVGVGVGDLGAAAAEQLDQLQRGRLAQVADVLLVGRRRRGARGSPSASARARSAPAPIFSKQKYGMFSLTLPASSMNSV